MDSFLVAVLALRDLDRAFAFLPVTGAEFIRLKGVEHAKDFFHVAANAQVRDHGEADDALRVDDVGCALRHAFVWIKDAERSGKLMLDVREHWEGKILQVLVVLAPGEMDEFGVDAGAEDLRVAFRELLGHLAEFRDLGWADEGEILGPEEEDEPFAFVGIVRNVLERVRDVRGNSGFELEGWEFLADAEHGRLL